MCVWLGGGGVYLMLHSHHQNDLSIRVDSNENHFNASLTVRGIAMKSVF